MPCEEITELARALPVVLAVPVAPVVAPVVEVVLEMAELMVLVSNTLSRLSAHRAKT